MADTHDLADHGPACGLVAGTPLATSVGWRPVETLRVGDGVLTFQHGIQPLVSLHSFPPGPAWLPLAPWPVHVPAGALDCRDDLLLWPDQPVLVEADCAEARLGLPFALIPAAALAGWRGIVRRRPPAGAQVIRPGFARAEMVYASRAVLVGCPAAAPGRAAEAAGAPALAALPLPDAEQLVRCLMAQDIGAALRAPPGGARCH